MKLTLLVILLSAGFWSRFTEVSEVNKWKEEAQMAFQKGKYEKASLIYQQLLTQASSNQSALQLNLAHSLRLSGKASASAPVYRQVARSTNPVLRSIAWQQLGNLAAQAKELKQALDFYKKALIANSRNETARYNYELVSRLLEKDQEQPKPPQQKQSGEQQKSADEASKGGQQDQPQSSAPGEGEQEKETKQGKDKGKEEGQRGNSDTSDTGNQPDVPGQENASPEAERMQTLRKRLETLNMTPEQAQILLNAMRDNEQQYLQQLPRPGKGQARTGKPNW
jgi:Ca-activated chloride channel family protein